MPETVLTRKRSSIARILVLAVIFSVFAGALPAQAHSVAISTNTPCPAATPSAGFTDIGGFDATTQLAINCLVAFGISMGTSATTFSPNDPVPRWQMALFLVRQAVDHGLTIPAATSQGYTDIGTFPQTTQDAINQVTSLGISKGTSTTTFSPNLTVSRWQMALFIYRTGVLAGVTFTNDSTHNEFADLAGQLAEAVTAINALADAHVALGTGGSLFSPNLPVLRWQMALFLTRLLAADGITSPANVRVLVTPTDSLTLAIGQARTFVATFKNADGTVYTGRVGIQVVEATSGAPVYNNTADNIFIEASSDGLLPPTGFQTVNGVAGPDGQVTFTIRHNGGAGNDTIPVAWQDLNLDNDYDSTGNLPPGEPFGLGGLTNFASGPATEATVGAWTVTVSKTTKANDVFEGATGGPTCAAPALTTCSFFYDANDIFQIASVAATLADFEDSLSIGDTVMNLPGVYDPDTADQSTFNISTDIVTPLAVTDPTAATSTSAGTYAIKGTADPGATIRIRDDVNLDGNRDPGENVVASGTADLDGVWTVTTPLQPGVANEFVASQIPVGGTEDVVGFNVPPITQGASVGATLVSSVGAEGAPAEIGLGPGDTITIRFSEGVSGVGLNDTITIQDFDGTVATLTLGPDVSFAVGTTIVTNDTLLLTVNIGVPGTGGTTGGIDGTTNITAITGFTDDDGETINVLGSGAGRTFDAP